MSTLRELIDAAIADLDLYKSPDTSAVEARIDELLKAAGWGSIAHDRLEYLSFSGSSLNIRTSYSVRGCNNDAFFEIPEAIIDTDDPVSAIKKLAHKQNVAGARAAVKEAERILALRKRELSEALATNPEPKL